MSKTPTVVSVLNLKGGVGKTTVTTLLARSAAQQGLDVLAVDLDPQANLSQALMAKDHYGTLMDEQQPSIVELFKGYRPPSPSKPGPSPLEWADIIRSVDARQGRKVELMPSRFDFSDNLIRAINIDEKVLAKFIAQHMQHKDLILIDCAPTESILTYVSYHASRYVLIPVKTEFFSTIGFPLMQKSLEDFRKKHIGTKIDVCGVLVNMTNTSGGKPTKDGSKSLKEIQKQAKEYNWDIFNHPMYYSAPYPRWVHDPYAGGPGNAFIEWPKIAGEILAKIGLEKKL